VGGPLQLELSFGDITHQPVDAIVNPASASLLPGPGVDGSIHRAAGPRLGDACRVLGHVAIGDAQATLGFELAARWVIHAVGPSWQGGGAGEARLLASVYRRCLEVADHLGARSVAFPAIGGDPSGYPVAEATEIAVASVRAATTDVRLVRFVCFDPAAYARYERALP